MDVEDGYRDLTLRWLERIDRLAAQCGGKVGGYWEGEEPGTADDRAAFGLATAVRGKIRNARHAILDGRIGTSTYALAVLSDLLLKWAAVDAGAAVRLKQIGLSAGPVARKRKAEARIADCRPRFDALVAKGCGPKKACDILAKESEGKITADVLYHHMVRKGKNTTC